MGRKGAKCTQGGGGLLSQSIDDLQNNVPSLGPQASWRARSSSLSEGQKGGCGSHLKKHDILKCRSHGSPPRSHRPDFFEQGHQMTSYRCNQGRETMVLRYSYRHEVCLNRSFKLCFIKLILVFLQQLSSPLLVLFRTHIYIS